MDHRFLLVTLLSLCSVPCAAAQELPSPPAHAQCKFQDGKDVTVNYSSPRRDGRTIFGSVVPYGQVWQTGADQPPTFVTTTKLMVGGKDVPAGSYTIFTIPGPDKWTLILNKQTGKLALPYHYESSELARIDLLVRPLASPLESLTISFDQLQGGCVLKLRWEKTEASALVAETK